MSTPRYFQVSRAQQPLSEAGLTNIPVNMEPPKPLCDADLEMRTMIREHIRSRCNRLCEESQKKFLSLLYEALTKESASFADRRRDFFHSFTSKFTPEFLKFCVEPDLHIMEPEIFRQIRPLLPTYPGCRPNPDTVPRGPPGPQYIDSTIAPDDGSNIEVTPDPTQVFPVR